jgi:hypothetical protein
MCYGTMRLSISLMRTSRKQGTRVITTLAEPVSNKDVSLLAPGFGLQPLATIANSALVTSQRTGHLREHEISALPSGGAPS